jgi:regulator of RNase E activity RraA
MSNDSRIAGVLSKVTTATITTILLKKGLRNVWLRGARPLQADQPRVVGRAFTLRFVPMREDLATPESWSSPKSTRAAIEQMPGGCIAVVDAGGMTDAGIFGDILCARMAKRGVAALVTDGVVVIPAALVGHVLELAPEQERLEAWIMQEVEKGTPLPGLYPASAETKARYEASKKK